MTLRPRRIHFAHNMQVSAYNNNTYTSERVYKVLYYTLLDGYRYLYPHAHTRTINTHYARTQVCCVRYRATRLLQGIIIVYSGTAECVALSHQTVAAAMTYRGGTFSKSTRNSQRHSIREGCPRGPKAAASNRAVPFAHVCFRQASTTEYRNNILIRVHFFFSFCSYACLSRTFFYHLVFAQLWSP